MCGLKKSGFNPVWRHPHPGESFTDCIEEYGSSLEDFSQEWNIPIDILRSFQRGEREIDDRMANVFAKAFVPHWINGEHDLGSEAGRKAFWMRLQEQYNCDHCKDR